MMATWIYSGWPFLIICQG